MAKKFKVGDRVRLDKKGNTGIISEITRGFAIIGRGPHSRQQDLKTLIRAKKK
jgi:hypothetical protein